MHTRQPTALSHATIHERKEQRSDCSLLTAAATTIVTMMGSVFFQNKTGITCLRETVKMVVDPQSGETIAHVTTNHLSCYFSSAVLPGIVAGIVAYKLAGVAINRFGWWPIHPAPTTV